MVVKVIGEPTTPAYERAVELVWQTGNKLYSGGMKCDLIIAPLLRRKLTNEELMNSTLGVLIFHPSPLPYGRGPSAIKWAYKRVEPITAATWFWANEDYDAGDICEMEIVKIDHQMRPREFYDEHILPAMGRTLRRALSAMAGGLIRRVPQVEAYATYDSKL